VDGTRVQHWDVPPLRDHPDDVIRRALDRLEIKVLSLLAELLFAPEHEGSISSWSGHSPSH
jgi:hypothetical protein